MTGSSVAVAARAAAESRTPLSPLPSSAIHASHSTPDSFAASAAGRALSEPPPPLGLDAAPVDRSPGFKSLPLLPGLAAFDIPSFDLVGEFEKSFSLTTISEDVSPRPATATDRTSQLGPQQANNDNNNSNNRNKAAAGATKVDGHARSRSKSMVDRPLSWLPSSKSSPNVRTTGGNHEQRPKRLVKQHVASPSESAPAAKPLERSRTVESFAEFAKRSWISKSRSPSPPSKPEKPRVASRSFSSETTSTSKTKTAPRSEAAADSAPDEPSSTRRSALNRASIYLTRIKQKPQAVFSRSSPSVAPKPPVGGSTAANDSEHTAPTLTPSSAPGPPPAVAKNASYNSVSSATSRASSQRASSVDTELDTDTATASSASENTSQATVETNLTMPHPTSRDPLWATYRTLDIEFSRFAAKGSTAGRMSVVRAILVPFLRSTAYHPSNSNRSVLSSEDFDRRATILNKWWNGLLAMLVGSSSRLPSGLGQGIASLGVQFPVLQPVAGVDRPTLLEATTMIMMRSEWRACTSQFQPLAERCPAERVRPRSGTGSTVASDADADMLLLDESAEHNVRTMFVTNLTAQMALVVEKLSLRHAPLSLVNWCGKACAYAFFFVPGVSDVLVRLWGLNADLLRRLAEEFGLPRRNRGESDDIVALFPQHLHKLGWSSAKALGDKLRVAAKLPMMLAKIHWHGPWVSRWRGGDTDLVFIFCKYFHILAQEFMPEGIPLVEKARAPAFVLVHAQLLSVLDSTIHRQASLDAMLGPPLSDALHGADAALTAPQLPSNLLRGMDENRLVVLLKDMLAENSFGVAPEIKHTFAEAFVAVAKAATKRTPRFEHASCFMLCDFLEESLVALDAFETAVNTSIATSPTEEKCFESYRPANYVDWPFWFEVGKMIMNSNNTMSEIRILSFLFSIWETITADPVRKEAVCLEWLLSDEVFAKFFNHWCPMVRAYYMRLLCWRICRDSGSSNELDLKIFLVVSQRLKTVWSHYLWLKQDAEARGRMHPSTAPSYPAPGKRFLIIRTEVQPPQHSLQVGFDSFSNVFPSADPALDYRGSVAGTGDSTASSARTDGNLSFKKRLSILGKVLPFGASQDSPTSEGKRTWEEELEQARRDTAASRLASRRGKTIPPQPLGPPTPPKQGPSSTTTGVRPSSDSVSSTGSTPLFDAATFVFRFTLTWLTGPNGGPMPCPPSRDRILTRPRLPAPAQARVSVRSAAGLNSPGCGANGAGAPPPIFRSDSPPPIAPGLPPETRRVSGLMQTGLVSEARNAKPLVVGEEQQAPRRLSMTKDGSAGEKRRSLSISVTPLRLVDTGGEETGVDDDGGDRLEIQSPVRVSMSMSSSGFPFPSSPSSGHDAEQHQHFRGRARSLDVGGGNGNGNANGNGPVSPMSVVAPPIRAEKPTGVYAPGAVYAGRALAEWSMVVSECNSFVDRRRDEGVLGLSEVEVPILGVEGLGIRARG